MAQSNRHSSLFGTNDWKNIYKTFSQVDLASYDFETLRKSFNDYLQLNYPETFNDYTESSEFIALLDVIAFMGQSLAFRSDLNARENFIDTAERRDSVVKLANLVGYTPKRGVAANGMLKVKSVRTSENVTDINGLNLSKIPVVWNDPANQRWSQQFSAILNATLVDSQRIGRPGNSKSIDSIKTDEYSINTPTSLPKYSFSAAVDGTSLPFELVSVTSVNSDTLTESTPIPTSKFNILKRDDKLGYGSADNGYFIYFKQGVLNQFNFSISQNIQNFVINISDIQGVNENDTWLTQTEKNGTIREWTKVEDVYATNNPQNTVENKTYFSVLSGYNDLVSYVFGDGVFAKIPSGNFTAYVRSSSAGQFTINPTEMQGITIDIPYISRTKRNETLTVTLDLVNPVTNSQARETISDIKLRAPTRFYTQNRMVNGEDYTNLPFTKFSSIIKSKAVARTSIGVSRGMDLLDPTGKYSSTTVTALDGLLYQKRKSISYSMQTESTNQVISFFTENLPSIISDYSTLQRYYSDTNPIVLPNTNDLTRIKWDQTTTNSTDCTGYFKINEVPISVGAYSSLDMAYATDGSILQISAPSGYYFTESNKLVTGSTFGKKTSYWVTVKSVVGDGFNGGNGNLPNNTGPVVLSGFVPTDAIVTKIIPVLTNNINISILNTALDYINVKRDFCLVYDPSIKTVSSRWSVTDYPNANSMIDFVTTSNDRYTITVKSLSYYFSSVNDVRFADPSGNLIYDPKTGKTKKDSILIGVSDSHIPLSVISKRTETSGYSDDFVIEVTAIANTLEINPNFFADLINQSSVADRYVFFQQIIDAAGITRHLPLESGKVTSAYGTVAQIDMVKFEYPIGQIFYAYGDNKFYGVTADPMVANSVLVVELTGYSAEVGKGNLRFDYNHYSSETSRVNPSTTNIIDIYMVLSSYYDNYSAWLKDSTGKVMKPDVPSIYELNSLYSELNSYKMTSDTVILNSVKFKALFGQKADEALRAKFRVIKQKDVTISDSDIKSQLISVINDYFDIQYWDFGDTFYFSELSSYIHERMGSVISSVSLIRANSDKNCPVYEIKSTPYEIFVNSATVSDIEVVDTFANIAC